MPTKCRRFDCDCPATPDLNLDTVDVDTLYRDTHGEPHRTDGPALIHAGAREWFRHGLWHRDDGPAVEEAVQPLWRYRGLVSTSDDVTDHWFERHQPGATPATRAVLHDLARNWPAGSDLATLYTAVAAATTN